MPTADEATQWRGLNLHGSDGDKIGSIEDVYLDRETGQPEWVAVKTGLFAAKVSFVPIAEARQDDDAVVVPYGKDQVKDAPNAEADGELSQDEEASLYRHYGFDYSEDRSDAGLPEGGGRRTGRDDEMLDERGRGVVGEDVSGPETDAAMTRSEEELRVGTTSRETGQVRLKKVIVTENVTQTVPVSREEVRVEREPITDANRDEAMAGGELTEEEHEVTLHAEEPVVEKRVVPKERVRVDKDVVTDEAQVSEEVRKERIDADEDAARR